MQSLFIDVIMNTWVQLLDNFDQRDIFSIVFFFPETTVTLVGGKQSFKL